MKILNLKKIFHFLLIGAAVPLMFIPVTSFADEIDLPCCTDESCPTEVVSPGEPEIIQGAIFKGVLVPFEDGDVLLTEFLGDSGYRDWKRSTLKMSNKARGRVLRDIAGKVRVYAHCSSSSEIVNLVKEKKLLCPEGDDIVLDQEKPICEDPETGPHSVVDISKTSRRDLDEIIGLMRQAEESRSKLESLSREYRENERSILRNKELMKKSGERLFGGGGTKQDGGLSALGVLGLIFGGGSSKF